MDNEMEPMEPLENEVEEKPKFSVNDWLKRFERSEKRMKKDFLPYYEAAKDRLQSKKSFRKRGRLTHEQVNLVYSIGNNFVNSVYFKAPSCNFTAREESATEKVEATEVAVNDYLKDNKVKNVIRRCIYDSYLGGFGARFLDYEYEDMEDPNNIIAPAQVDEMGNEIAPAQLGRIVLKNEIVLKRIRPDLVRFPEGFDFDNAQSSPWLGFDMITPLEEVKSEQKYDQETVQRIKGSSYSALTNDEHKNTDNDEKDLYAKISYVFIRPETPLQPMTLVVFCKDCTDKPLFMTEFDKGIKDYPIKFIYFNPLDDDCSYPKGDPWVFEAQSAAVDKWWKTVSNHVEKANPKTIYDASAIDKAEVNNLRTSDDLAWVGLKNQKQRPLGELVQELERASVPNDVNNFYEVARSLLSEISPKSGLTRGAQDAKTDTATEAKIIQMGENIDTSARVDVVKDFLIDICLDVAGVLEESLAAPIPVKMTRQVPGPDGMPQEVEIIEEVGKNGFTSKINVDIAVEEMQAQNKEILRRQIIDSIGLFVKLGGLMAQPSVDENGQLVPGKTINVQFWMEKLFELMNIRNIEKGFRDLPAPPPAVVPPEAGLSSQTSGSPEKPPISPDADLMASEIGQGMEV